MESELPAGWELVKMSELCNVVNGSTPKTGNEEFWDGDILWITPKDLTGFKDVIINDTSRKISKKGYDSCSTHLVPAGTVLMSSRAPIGYLAIAGKEICTNQGFKSFVCSDRLNNRYLYYHLKSIVPRLKQEGQGTTFDELSKTKAENIDVPIPFPKDKEKSLKIQKQIVAKLDAFFKEYDILKEEKEKANNNYEKIGLVSFSKLLETKKCESVTVADVIKEMRYGSSSKAHSHNQGCPILRMNNITSAGELSLNGLKYIKLPTAEEKKYLLENGDILINRTNSKELVGKCAVFREKGMYIYASYLIRMRVDTRKVLPEYLVYYLSVGLGREEINKRIRGVTNQWNINAEEIKIIPLLLPSLEDQKWILSQFISLTKNKVIEKEQEKIILLLGNLPRAVLTKAFAGELVA